MEMFNIIKISLTFICICYHFIIKYQHNACNVMTDQLVTLNPPPSPTAWPGPHPTVHFCYPVLETGYPVQWFPFCVLCLDIHLCQIQHFLVVEISSSFFMHIWHRRFSISLLFYIVREVNLSWSFSIKREDFDSAPDKLPTDRTLPHGGGAVLTTGQVTTGQEGYGYVLLHADLTQDLVLQARVLHLQRCQLCNKISATLKCWRHIVDKSAFLKCLKATLITTVLQYYQTSIVL